MIFVIDDDLTMAECVATACGEHPVRVFSNAIDAIAALNDVLPNLILLDIMLDGPDGFTFLNELMSYEDTAKIPILIVSSLDLSGKRLDSYNVVGILNKDTMTPKDIQKYIREYAHVGD